MDNDSEWTAQVQADVKNKIKECAHLSSIHSQASLENQRMHQLFTALAIFFSPLGGVFSSVGGTINQNSPVLFPILATISAFVATLLITCVKTAKWQDLQLQHRDTAIRFHKLRHQLQSELSLSKIDRTQADKFVRLANETFFSIQSAAPIVKTKLEPMQVVESQDASTETSQLHFPVKISTESVVERNLEYELERLCHNNTS